MAQRRDCGDQARPAGLSAPEPYERLLGDALEGDASLFTREDSVEETWRIVQPLLDAPPPVEPYKPGSWGPASADKLLAGHPSWRDPWLHSHATRRHRLRTGTLGETG